MTRECVSGMSACMAKPIQSLSKYSQIEVVMWLSGCPA